MNILNKIKVFIGDFLKKRYIRKELDFKFDNHQIVMNKRNSEKLSMLTESLFRASKIIGVEVLEAERKRLENENVKLFDDIKKVIDKHYKDREETLKKENEKLNRELKKKDKKINEIKEKILTVGNSK